MSRPQFYGCHLSASGGLENALKSAQALGINTVQLHPTAPQKWISKPFPIGCETAFKDFREASGVKKVFFHGQYLINLATANPNQAHLARQSLSVYLDLISRLNGDGVIFHVGSSKDHSDEQAAFQICAEMINAVLADSPSDSRLLLEVAAGSGNIIGDRMEELATIYNMVTAKERVGFALDSQHMWASGYDLQHDLAGILRQASDIFGFEKIWAIHLNDSMTELASKKDRHENLGDGLIGEAALRAFFTSPELAAIPFILETPAMKDPALTVIEVEKLRTWAAKDV